MELWTATHCRLVLPTREWIEALRIRARRPATNRCGLAHYGLVKGTTDSLFGDAFIKLSHVSMQRPRPPNLARYCTIAL